MSVRLILAAVALGAAAACGSSSTPAMPTPPSGSTITVNIPSGATNLTTTAFGMNPLTVARGAAVTWVNGDNTAHTATANDGMTFNSGILAAGGRFTFTFQNAGTFPYRCTIHPNMVGTVMVQ